MSSEDQPDPLTVDVILPLSKSEDGDAQLKAVARKLKVHPKRIQQLRLQKHSLDARKAEIKVQLRFEVGLDSPLPDEPEISIHLPSVSDSSPSAIIVGSGPAGMFAALTALEKGWKPIVLERGKDASARRYDLAPILRHGNVIEDSNYCF
ncbi:MAG: FAD-binding protein, partial [Verrucomicrobiota bacterium]